MMDFPKFAAYGLTALAAAAALLAPAVGGLAPAAHAAPPGPHLPIQGVPAPVDSYAMGDSANCFVDYTMWIDRDASRPYRVVGHIQPKGVRPIVPGVPVPANCSTTLILKSATDRALWNIAPDSRFVRVNADRTGGAPVQVDLPYQPDAAWVNLGVTPVTTFIPYAGLAASPFFDRFTAMNL